MDTFSWSRIGRRPQKPIQSQNDKTVLQGCGHELYDKATKTLLKSSPDPMTTVDSGDARAYENEGEDSSVHN